MGTEVAQIVVITAMAARIPTHLGARTSLTGAPAALSIVGMVDVAPNQALDAVPLIMYAVRSAIRSIVQLRINVMWVLVQVHVA